MTSLMRYEQYLTVQLLLGKPIQHGDWRLTADDIVFLRVNGIAPE